MPANLTPEYEKAEQRYRQAADDEERLAALQEMLSAIPKHKGTEKMQADLKRRLSQLRKAQAKGAGGRARAPNPFHIPKSGAGQVILIGPPNSGKSSLLTAVTRAEAKVAEYPYTTVLPQPGMWERAGRPIELVDTPPFAADHLPPGLIGATRAADIVCPVVEAGEAALNQIETVLEVLAGRGLTLHTAPRDTFDRADPAMRCGLILANKAELADPGSLGVLQELYADRLEVLAISARTGQGLEGLFERLWQLLALIRVFSKEPGRPPDLTKPFILAKGSTVEDLARHIHRELPEKMKHARLWGQGRHDGQQVHRTEPLRDEDIVEIHE